MLTRVQITIPAAGTFEKITYGGKGVIVESIPVYKTPEDVPLLKLQDLNQPGQPIYPQSKYTHQGNNAFESFYVLGTAESAGDEVYFLVSDVCITAEINTNTSDLLTPYPGQTKLFTATNAVQTFSPADYILNGRFPVAMYVTPQFTGGALQMLYSFGIDPVNATPPFGNALGYDQTANVPLSPAIIKFAGIEYIRNFRWIRFGATNVRFFVTFEY